MELDRRGLGLFLTLILSSCCNTQDGGTSSSGGSGTGTASSMGGSTGGSSTGGSSTGGTAGCPDTYCAPGFICNAATQDTCLCDGNSCVGECDPDAGGCRYPCADAGDVGWFGLEPSWEDIPYAIHLPAADLGAMYGYDVQWFCADEPSMAPQYAALTPMPPGLKLQPGGLIWGRATALSDGGPYEFEIEATVNPSGATHVQNFLLNVVEPGSGDGG